MGAGGRCACAETVVGYACAGVAAETIVCRPDRHLPSLPPGGAGLCAEPDMPDIVRLVLGNVRLILGNVRLKSTMVAGFQAWAGNVQASNLAAHSPGG